MSLPGLHSDGADQVDPRERMEVLVLGLVPRIQKMEERQERTEGKLRQLLMQLEKRKGQDAKKRKRCEEMEDSSSRDLQLQFTIQPSPRIFTKTKVKGEKSVALQLELVDPLTREVVYSGPESSMEVELVLVNGDFTGSETGNGTWKYFKENIVPGRRGKQPILIGEIVLKLNKGVAVVRNLKITDNSSWVPSKSFRLAARVTDGYFGGIRVKEAITNPFVVIECRLKSSEKNYPPFPKDPLWRLEKISKKGAVYQRLTKQRIHTVGDFLKSLDENEDGLRSIAKMATSTWEATVEHAKTCDLSDERIKSPISIQQVEPVEDVAPPKKVFKQQPVQDSYEQHGVVGGSANAPIDFSSQASAESLDMGVINEGYASTFGGASGNFLLDAMFSPLVPAPHVNPFYGLLQENDSLELGSEDTAEGVWSFDFDHDPKPLPERKEDLYNMTRNSIDTQGRVNVSSAAGFPNISAESTHKDERAPKNFR